MKLVNSKRLVPTLTFGRVIGGAAVLLLLSAGTAYAANEWTGANIVDGSLTTDDIANNSLQGTDIASGTIVSGDIANDTVTNVDIADNTIRSNELQNSAVTAAKILDATITGADIDNGSLDGADIANGSLDGTEVADESLTTSDILNASLTADDLASNSVGFDEIQTDAVQATEIADNSIDSGEIVDFQLSNQDIGVLFAQVNADGTLANSSGSVTSGRVGATGSYEVDFARNISSCAFTATIGPAGGGSALGEVNVADRSGNAEAVFVDTNNSDGSTADLPFSLMVVC